MQDYLIDDQGRMTWSCEPVSGKRLSMVAEEIRHEHTGMHATIFVTLEDALLATRALLGFDTFNIGRDGDRVRLANKAYRAPSNGTKEAYSNESLSHDLDLFCLQIIRRYEADRFVPVRYNGAIAPPPISFAVDPYIISGGGSIFYAPPGAGKSLTLQAMAIEISQGASGLFSTEQRSVLYINLERSEISLIRRHAMLLRSLGHKEAPVDYIHARGQSLAAIAGAARRFARERDDPLIIVDSLSRAGTGGSLNDDTTANKFTDLMNSFGATWAAVGHAPRHDSTHVFGSVHQDAGADIMVQVSSQRVQRLPNGKTMGVQLRITKENDVGETTPDYIAYEFGTREEGLVSIRLAKPHEFSELTLDVPMTREERVRIYLVEEGPSTQAAIVDGTGLNQGDVSKLLHGSAFVRLEATHGKAHLYGPSTYGGAYVPP